jgi:hypothetical protein
LAVLLPGLELDAANAITARKWEELDNAGLDLITVQPTTFAGLITLLSHIVECSRSEKGEDWRLPCMLLFDNQTGRLRPAEFLEPRSEKFAYFAMLAVTNTIRRLVAARPCHDCPSCEPCWPARRGPFQSCGESAAPA